MAPGGSAWPIDGHDHRYGKEFAIIPNDPGFTILKGMNRGPYSSVEKALAEIAGCKEQQT